MKLKLLLPLLALALFAADGYAQVKKVKSWSFIGTLFSMTRVESEKALLVHKFNHGSDAMTNAGTRRSFVDTRTLYMDPTAGVIMYDSVNLYYRHEILQGVTFMFGNDNGDEGIAAADLMKFDKDLVTAGFDRQVTRTNVYTEKRSYSHPRFQQHVHADIWLQDNKILMVEMTVSRSDIDHKSLRNAQ